jgi:hypothetical protein
MRAAEQGAWLDRKAPRSGPVACLCDLIRGRWPDADRPSQRLMARGYAPHPDYGDDQLSTDWGGDEAGVEHTEGYEERPWEAPDPLAGGYTSPMTLTRMSAMVEDGPSHLLSIDPFQRLWDLHAPTDRVTPQYPALHLARGLQAVDSCTPVTEWQHNYGFQMIVDTQLPALESPRYSYAAIDANDLLDEARSRVMGTLYG